MASPGADGHLGDLPTHYVAADGNAVQPGLSPWLKSASEVTNRAFLVHAGGDICARRSKRVETAGPRLERFNLLDRRSRSEIERVRALCFTANVLELRTTFRAEKLRFGCYF